MILQGLFRILEMYFIGINEFYSNVDKYFLEKIRHFLGIRQEIAGDLRNSLKEITHFLIDEFVELGLYRAKVQNRFYDKFLILEIEENDSINSINDLYEKRIAPLVYEIILEQIIFYLVDNRGSPIILCLKNKGLITLEFIYEIRNVKKLIDNSPDKLEKLRKYIRIRDKVIIKFCENKEKIENLEDLYDPQRKVQLFYLIYEIIDFFNIQNFFNFSNLKEFLADHFEDCMEKIPRISLKNPDLCYCALYLANELKINFNLEKIKNFLQELYKDLLNDFKVPIIEATNQIYFYLQSTSLVKLWLTNDQIKSIARLEPSIFESQCIENLETSQLANVLVLFIFLRFINSSNLDEMNNIKTEIKNRITPSGILQNRGGFYSSESTYYVILSYYLNNNIENLKTLISNDLLDNIISKIYRNLEILEFSKDMNMDLLSELFYSNECLRLINCINLKEFKLLLARYLFPKEIELKIQRNEVKHESIIGIRHLTVDKITGETNYITH